LVHTPNSGNDTDQVTPIRDQNNPSPDLRRSLREGRIIRREDINVNIEEVLKLPEDPSTLRI
jgi:hypothetical protein